MKKLLNTLTIALLTSVFFISCGSTKVVNNSFTPTGDYLVDSVNYTMSLSSPNNKAYYEEGAGYIYDHDTGAADKLIEKWEKESPLDADLFVIRYNNEYGKAVSKTLLQSPQIPQDRPYLTMQGENGETIYMYEDIALDKEGIKIASDTLEEALTYHPTRLDIWFGLIRTYLDAGSWSDAEDAFNRCLEVLDKTDNRWLWTTNATVFHTDGSREQNDMDFIMSAHDYLLALYSVGTEETYNIATRMTSSLFKHFPDNVVLLNLVAGDNMNLGNFDEGKKLLLRAYEIDSTDLIVIANLALVSCLENNEEDFNKYYDAIMKSGDEGIINQVKGLKDKYFNKVLDNMQR